MERRGFFKVLAMGAGVVFAAPLLPLKTLSADEKNPYAGALHVRWPKTEADTWSLSETDIPRISAAINEAYPSLSVLHGRSGRSIFTMYDPATGMPTAKDVFYVLRSAGGYSRLLDGGALPSSGAALDDSGTCIAAVQIAAHQTWRDLERAVLKAVEQIREKVAPAAI